jgi:hypothetical protein
MVRGLRVLGVGCLVLALAAGQVLAQGKGKQGKRFGFMGGGMGGGQQMTLMLLRADKVQKELDLVQEQKDKLKELADKVQKDMQSTFQGMGNLRDLSDEERQAKMKEIQDKVADLTKKAQKEVDGILLPKQSSRLKEISVQLRGIMALVGDKEVSDKLKITDQQKEKMQTAQREAFQKVDFRALFQEDQAKAREKMAEVQKEANEKVLDVLNADQKEEYAKMKGDKVDFTMQDIMQQIMPNFGKGKGGFGGFGKAPAPAKEAPKE